MEMNKEVNVGMTIKNIRKSKKLLLKEVASKCGISSSMLSQIEKGNANPSLNTIKSIAQVLEVPLFKFFIDSDKEKYEFHLLKKNERKIISTEYVTYELLSPDVETKSATVENQYSRNSTSSPNPAPVKLGKRVVVVGAGQVQKRKGIDDFITLAEELPDITFIWAGGFSFGGITDGYERYKKIMDNPPENLIFPGIVEPERMKELYALADLFLLPSYNELFPMTILEAASCEAPIMLRDLDLYKVILEGNYRPTTDVEEMKQAIMEYREHPEALKELREKAKAISREYSEEHLLEIWLKFYREQAALGKK